MTSRRSRAVHLLALLALAIAAIAAGCGGGNKAGYGAAGDAGVDSSSGGGGDGAAGEGGLIGGQTVKSLALSPPTATLTCSNGAGAQQPYTLTAQYADGSSATVTAGVTWTSDSPAVGSIGSTGVYAATGSLGGVVHVTATYMGQKASATLTVKLLVQSNPGNVPSGAQAGLQGATSPDASVVWAYPYDGTVWARGLLPPTLQWNGGAATDDYYVHVVSPTFELQEFTTATGAP
ncbi:MAG: hypothetical protein ACRELB_08450, partial [Polyangiaceae bacterium]